jgi:hypothetical protein
MNKKWKYGLYLSSIREIAAVPFNYFEYTSGGRFVIDIISMKTGISGK